MASGSIAHGAAAFTNVLIFFFRRDRLGSSPDLLTLWWGGLASDSDRFFFWRERVLEKRESEGRDGAGGGGFLVVEGRVVSRGMVNVELVAP